MRSDMLNVIALSAIYTVLYMLYYVFGIEMSALTPMITSLSILGFALVSLYFRKERKKR